MAKRSQKDSGEERVTAKSRPMMNLIARTPSFVSSSVSPEKKHYGNQYPWKSVAGEDGSGQSGEETDLFEASRRNSSRRSRAIGEETLPDRSGRPDNINSPEVVSSQNFIMGSDTTELELSVESRTFVNRVNDQVRKRQKNSNLAGEGEEHSIIW